MMVQFIYALIYIRYDFPYFPYACLKIGTSAAIAQVSSGASVETWHFWAHRPWPMQLEQLAKAFEARFGE